MESIERVTRLYLQSDGVKQTSDHSVQLQIVSSVLKNSAILSRWDILAAAIPPRLESLSLELLKEIATLWTTVRCFSYAKSFNEKKSHEDFQKHGTRKTLKQK